MAVGNPWWVYAGWAFMLFVIFGQVAGIIYLFARDVPPNR